MKHGRNTDENQGVGGFFISVFYPWPSHIAANMPPLPSSPPPTPQIIDLTAKHKVEGLRLDQYLASMFPDRSRSVIQRVIEADGVLVNGKPGKASYRVRYGDQVRIVLPAPTHDLPVPEDIPLHV